MTEHLEGEGEVASVLRVLASVTRYILVDERIPLGLLIRSFWLFTTLLQTRELSASEEPPDLDSLHAEILEHIKNGRADL